MTSVSVTERSTTSITLSSKVDVDKDWSYFFQMNGESVLLPPNRATGVVSHTFTSLQPGRAYPFSVITQFFELNSTAYEDYTVTRNTELISLYFPKWKNKILFHLLIESCAYN